MNHLARGWLDTSSIFCIPLFQECQWMDTQRRREVVILDWFLLVYIWSFRFLILSCILCPSPWWLQDVVMRTTMTCITFPELASYAIVEVQGIDSLEEVLLFLSDDEIESLLCKITCRPGGLIPGSIIGGLAPVAIPGVTVTQRLKTMWNLWHFIRAIKPVLAVPSSPRTYAQLDLQRPAELTLVCVNLQDSYYGCQPCSHHQHQGLADNDGDHWGVATSPPWILKRERYQWRI